MNEFCKIVVMSIAMIFIALAILSLFGCASTKEISNTYKYIDSVFVQKNDCTIIRPIFKTDSSGNKIYLGNDTTIVKYNVINRIVKNDTTIIKNQPTKTIKEKETKTEKVGFFYKFGVGAFGFAVAIVFFIVFRYLKNPLGFLIKKLI